MEDRIKLQPVTYTKSKNHIHRAHPAHPPNARSRVNKKDSSSPQTHVITWLTRLVKKCAVAMPLKQCGFICKQEV